MGADAKRKAARKRKFEAMAADSSPINIAATEESPLVPDETDQLHSGSGHQVTDQSHMENTAAMSIATDEIPTSESSKTQRFIVFIGLYLP